MAIPLTIDTHAHYFPESYLKLIADHGKRCGATVVTESGKTFIQVGLLLRTGPITSHFYDLDDRIKDHGPAGRPDARAVAHAADGLLGRRRSGPPALRCFQRRDQRGASPTTPTASSALRACRSRTPISRCWNSSGWRSCPAYAAFTWRPPCATASSRTGASSRCTSASPILGYRFSCTR